MNVRERGLRALLRSAHGIGRLMPCRNFIASLTFSESFSQRIRGLVVWKCAGISKKNMLVSIVGGELGGRGGDHSAAPASGRVLAVS